MIEQELKAGLGHAVADEPPLAFDADRLIATAQRQHARRRALAGVGAATAAVAVAAVAVPVLLHGGERDVVTATAPSTITTAAHPSVPRYPWPPSGIHVRDFDAPQLTALAGRWTPELRRVFPAVAPDARNVSVQKWDLQPTDATPTKRNFTDTFVRFTVHGVQTAVSIEIYGPGADPTGPNALCASDAKHSLAASEVPPLPASEAPSPTCQISLRGDTALVRETMTPFAPVAATPHSTPSRMLTVSQFRADGSVVTATAYNYDPAGDASITMPRPPLTAAQLTTLATDSILTF